MPQVQKLVNSILRDLKPLQTALGFHKVYVHYIKADENELARYISGTMDNPHFVLNARGIYNAAKEDGVNLGTTIETTLVHEFGHAYLEMCGIDTRDHDEDVVEDFAREYNDYRNIKPHLLLLPVHRYLLLNRSRHHIQIGKNGYNLKIMPSTLKL